MRLGTAIKLGILIRNFQAFKEGYFYRLLSVVSLIDSFSIESFFFLYKVKN